MMPFGGARKGGEAGVDSEEPPAPPHPGVAGWQVRLADYRREGEQRRDREYKCMMIPYHRVGGRISSAPSIAG